VSERVFYHLTSEPELRDGLGESFYRPAHLSTEGFVHCSFDDVLLAVANDYFGQSTLPVWVLEIDPARLGAETRYEAPAPIPDAGRAHLSHAHVFPHVYGPIDRAAILRAGVLVRTPEGFAWPEVLGPLDEMLGAAGGGG